MAIAKIDKNREDLMRLTTGGRVVLMCRCKGLSSGLMVRQNAVVLDDCVVFKREYIPDGPRRFSAILTEIHAAPEGTEFTITTPYATFSFPGLLTRRERDDLLIRLAEIKRKG